MRALLAYAVFVPLSGLSLACGINASPTGTGGGLGSAGTGGAVSSGGSSGGGTSPTGGSSGVDRSCNQSNECTLVSNTCCGGCGVPSALDMNSVRKGEEVDYLNSVCTGEYACPDCATLPNPNLFALCVLPTPDSPGACKAKDLTMQPEAKCTVASDCVVKPRACCECGADDAPGNLVALRADSTAFLEGVLCEPSQPCNDCLWLPPANVSAVCEDGVCAVNDLRVP